MAHELMLDDEGKAAMFYVDDVPWHRQGTGLQAPPTASHAIQAAKLDWEVVRVPISFHPAPDERKEIPNKVAILPGKGWTGKTRPLFGVVSGQYKILQNRDAFSFFDPMVKSGYATYETAGALGKGERVWVLAKLREDFEVGKGDRVRRYLLLSNRHDGHASVRVKFTPIRVVCWNTLSVAMNDGVQACSVRHDHALVPNLQMAADLMMDRIESRYREIRESFQSLLFCPVDRAGLDAYLAKVFPVPPAPEDARHRARWEQARAAAFWSRRASEYLYRKSDSCRMAGETGWAAYNAVTEFVDHCRPANSRDRLPDAQLNRIWFGDGYRIKLRAFKEALKQFLN